MSIDLKFVELTADILEMYFIKYTREGIRPTGSSLLEELSAGQKKIRAPGYGTTRVPLLVPFFPVAQKQSREQRSYVPWCFEWTKDACCGGGGSTFWAFCFLNDGAPLPKIVGK